MQSGTMPTSVVLLKNPSEKTQEQFPFGYRLVKWTYVLIEKIFEKINENERREKKKNIEGTGFNLNSRE